MYQYRVEQNPNSSWAIIELWEGGIIRSPFDSKDEAIKREQDIARYFQFDECLELLEGPEAP